jgi:hypothetical protein
VGIATANWNRSKAPLKLSISHFQRVFSSRHIDDHSGRRRWSYDTSLKIALWGGCRCELLLRISIV